MRDECPVATDAAIIVRMWGRETARLCTKTICCAKDRGLHLEYETPRSPLKLIQSSWDYLT